MKRGILMTLHRSEVNYFSGLDALETTIGYNQIVASLQAALPNHCVQNYFEQKPTLLADANHLAVAWSDSPNGSNSNVIGLIAGRNYIAKDRIPTFVHISTLHVAETQQRGLLLMRLIAAIYIGIWELEGNLPTWTAIKTFNPSVYNALLKLMQIIGKGAVLYPTFTGKNNEYEDMLNKDIIAGIASCLEPNCLFDDDAGAIRGGGGTVGSSYWPTKPRSSHCEINRFFDKCLDSTDRMLCIFGLDDEYGKLAAIKFLNRWIGSSNSHLSH